MLEYLFDIPDEVKYEYSEPTTPENYIAQYVVNSCDFVYYKNDPKSIDLWAMIKARLRQQIFDKLGDELLSGSPICTMARYVTWDTFDSFEKVIQLRVQLQKVQTMNIIMPKWEPVEVYQGHKVEVKLLCAACGNVWIQSARGACSSCGAPANWTIK